MTEEDQERKRVRLFRVWAGIEACGRFFHPEWKPTRAAALVELLMWWEALDKAADRLYPTYKAAVHEEGLLPIRNALRYARHMTVHQAWLMNELVVVEQTDGTRVPLECWIDLKDEQPDAKSLKGWRSYQAHLAGKPILPTVMAISRVFHAVFEAEPPQWLLAGKPGPTKPE